MNKMTILYAGLLALAASGVAYAQAGGGQAAGGGSALHNYGSDGHPMDRTVRRLGTLKPVVLDDLNYAQICLTGFRGAIFNQRIKTLKGEYALHEQLRVVNMCTDVELRTPEQAASYKEKYYGDRLKNLDDHAYDPLRAAQSRINHLAHVSPEKEAEIKKLERRLWSEIGAKIDRYTDQGIPAAEQWVLWGQDVRMAADQVGQLLNDEQRKEWNAILTDYSARLDQVVKDWKTPKS